MRKHFLLLFLMALLPLAGWALDDVSTAWRVTISDIDYGSATPAPTVKWLYNNEDVTAGDYQVAYYTDANCTDEVVIGQNTKLDAADAYYVKVTALPASGYQGAIIKSFTVNKKVLTYTLNEGTGNNQINLTATYKKENFTKTFTLANLTITGAVNNEAASDLFTVTNGTWDYSGTAANADKDGALLPNATGYAVILQGITAKAAATTNYTVSYTTNYVKIKQAVIDLSENTPFTASAGSYVAANGLVYTGNENAPTYTIKYTYGNGDNDYETLTQGTDFTVKYRDGDADTNVSPWYVNEDFNSYINAVSNTNYVASETFANTKLGTFKIVKNTTDKLPLIVVGKDKPYDGTAFTLASAEFIPGQLADGDRGLEITGLAAKISTVENHTANLAKNVAKYYVMADYSNAKITKNEQQYSLSDLYEIVTPEQVWEITRADLTITVTASALTYGQAISASEKTITVTGGAEYNDGNNDVNENTLIKAYYQAAVNTAYNDGETTPYSTWTTETAPAQGTYAEAITVGFAEANADHSLLANYNDPTIVNATLTVNGAPFIIQPTITNVEYGTAVTESYLALDASTYSQATVTGTPVYNYKPLNADDSEYTTTKPTTIGKWTVKVTGLSGTGNYVNGVATPAERDFEITKKTLNLKVNDVELWEGASWEILQSKAGVETEPVFAYNEHPKLYYRFNTPINNLTVNEDTEGNQTTISFQNGFTAAANQITVYLDPEDENSAHYKLVIDEAGGKLNKTNTQNALPLDLDGTLVKVEDAMAISTANPGVKYDVTISGRTLDANDWNVLVLPFTITPYDFCQKIGGYAIFNTLKSANTTNNTVKFGLELANLPANEPFLVKPLAAVNFDETYDHDNNYATAEIRKYVFDDQTIVSGNPIKDDVDGVKFIGTYETKDVELVNGTADADGYVDDGGEAGSKISFLAKAAPEAKAAWYSATNTDGTKSYKKFTNFAATKAYLDFRATSLVRPTILVEEADGSTTAISAITNEGVAVKAEGWYTIDGMKLNAAPTQKGVYINNGKKIVVK